MIGPLVLVSALGFNAIPNSKVLALRGGAISTDALIDTVSALNVAAGGYAWLAPKKNLEMYGVTNAKDVDVFFMRSIAALNIVLAAALNSGKSDFNKAALTFIMGHAIQCAACTPLVEKLNVPMGGIIGSGLVILGLGQLTQLGILKPEHLTNVAIFAYCVISLQELLMPKPTLEAFGFPDATAVTKMLMGSYATVKLQVGTFLLVNKLTGNLGLGVAATMATGIFACIKAVLEGKETGIDKAGPLAWGVVQAAIGILAYMSTSA